MRSLDILSLSCILTANFGVFTPVGFFLIYNIFCCLYPDKTHPFIKQTGLHHFLYIPKLVCHLRLEKGIRDDTDSLSSLQPARPIFWSHFNSKPLIRGALRKPGWLCSGRFPFSFQAWPQESFRVTDCVFCWQSSLPLGGSSSQRKGLWVFPQCEVDTPFSPLLCAHHL